MVPDLVAILSVQTFLLIGCGAGGKHKRGDGGRDGDPSGLVVGVEVKVKRCPEPPNIQVAPLEVAVGGLIGIMAMATDSDAGVVTVEWRATGGRFADPAAASTTYECSTPGTHTLTLTVTQGDCVSKVVAQVTCR